MGDLVASKFLVTNRGDKYRMKPAAEGPPGEPLSQIVTSVTGIVP